jgi:hypothetical protein
LAKIASQQPGIKPGKAKDLQSLLKCVQPRDRRTLYNVIKDFLPNYMPSIPIFFVE